MIPSKSKSISVFTVKEIERLRKEIKDRDELISQYEAKEAQQKERKAQTAAFQLQSSCQDLHSIEEKFDTKLEKFKEIIIEEIKKNNDKTEKQISATNKTFAEMVRSNPPNTNNKNIKDSIQEQLRSVIAEERSIQINEERERSKRSKNIIIHGVGEILHKESHLQKVGEMADKIYINKVLKDLRVDNVNVKETERFGRHMTNKDRPLRVILNSESEKQKIFTHLKNLKGKMKYKGVSITEDFTANERRILKHWRQKMKDKNEKETTEYQWRLYGYVDICPSSSINMQ